MSVYFRGNPGEERWGDSGCTAMNKKKKSEDGLSYCEVSLTRRALVRNSAVAKYGLTPGGM